LELTQLVDYLDSYLRSKEIEDSSLNGLQVEAGREVTKVALVVDCSIPAFEKARNNGAELIIAHHGLIWDKAPITGPMYRRVKFLIENQMGLYAAHLPLDMHPEVGNNAQLARLGGLRNPSAFARHRGSDIGYIGELPGIPLGELLLRLQAGLGAQPRVFSFGPDRISFLALCSGRADRDLKEAIEKGADTYLTGETSHEAVSLARDAGVNLIFGGHYATETLGLKALGSHIHDTFGLEVVFIDEPTGL